MNNNEGRFYIMGHIYWLWSGLYAAFYLFAVCPVLQWGRPQKMLDPSPSPSPIAELDSRHINRGRVKTSVNPIFL